MDVVRRPSMRAACGASALAAVVTALLVVGCAVAPAATPSPSASAAPTASATGVAQGSPSSHSTDPIAAWTRLPTTDALRGATLSRVVSGPTGLLAIGSSERSGFTTWTSADGVGWVGSAPFTTFVPTAGLASADGFVVLGKAGDGSELEQAMVWRSPDGGSWIGARIDGLKTSPIGAGRIGDRIATFALRAPSGGEPTLAWSSGDLVSWTSAGLGGGGSSNAAGLATLSDGSGLAFGRWSAEPMDTAPYPPGQAACWRSTDGWAWQKTVDDPDLASALIVDVAQREGGAIAAVGQRWNPAMPPEQAYVLVLWASSDGTSWEPVARPPGIDPTAVPERVVATPSGYLLLASAPSGGANALVAASADGRTWVAIDPVVPFEGGRANDLVVHGERLVAVGQLLPADNAIGDGAVWIGPWTNSEGD